jgi:hypothetical protein
VALAGLEGGLPQGEGVARGAPSHPAFGYVREPLCQATLSPRAGRDRRRDPERDRSGGKLPYPRRYGDGIRDDAGRQHGNSGQLEGPGGEDLHRRLRGRILLAGLPKAPTSRRHQDRQVLREGLGRRRGGHGDRSHDYRVGAHPGFEGHSRRGGDRRALGALGGDGLRHGSGLPFRQADASRGDPSAAHFRPPF